MEECPTCKSRNIETTDTDDLTIYYCKDCSNSWVRVKRDVALFQCQRCGVNVRLHTTPFRATYSYLDKKGYSHQIVIEYYLCQNCLRELNKLIKRFVNTHEKKV